MKSRKILALANSPNVPLALSVMTSGASFLTNLVRRAVSGSAGLSTMTRIFGFCFSNCLARSWKYACASGLNWKKVRTVLPPSSRLERLVRNEATSMTTPTTTAARLGAWP